MISKQDKADNAADPVPQESGSGQLQHNTEHIDATHLFVRDGRRVRGPFSLGALQAMQQRSEIRRETLLSPDRIRWVAASDLPDLFPQHLFERQLPATVEEMQWHYVSEGLRHGPVSWEILQTMAASGQLQPLDSVLPENSQAWIPARAVEGLTFAGGSDVLGIVRHRQLWLFGAGSFVLLFLVIPAVLMLTWDEGRIRRNESVADREDLQTHESELAALERQHRENINRINSQTKILVAEIAAKAIEAKTREERRQFERQIETQKQLQQEKLAAEDRRHRERLEQAERHHFDYLRNR